MGSSVLQKFSRHRIITSRMQWVTSADSLDTHIAPFEDSVLCYRLRHILRTRRFKAAVVPQMRGNDLLVETDQECEELAHQVKNKKSKVKKENPTSLRGSRVATTKQSTSPI